MNNWQDVIDYVYGEIEGIQYFKSNKPSVNNILNLANESLLSLTVDYVLFPNANSISNVAIVDIPNNCVDVKKILIKDEEIKRCNMDTIQYENDLAYCVSEYRILFNKNISANVGEFKVLGKGKFSLFTKNPNDRTVFDLLPNEYHYLPIYFILQRLFVRCNDLNKAQYYQNAYNNLRNKYEWSIVVRKTKPCDWQFNMEYDEENYTDSVFDRFPRVITEYHSQPTISPSQVDEKIANAMSTTYTRGEIDSKDTTARLSALTESKTYTENYTFSKDDITAKDNNVKAYTDEKVGDIEDAIDNILGE